MKNDIIEYVIRPLRKSIGQLLEERAQHRKTNKILLDDLNSFKKFSTNSCPHCEKKLVSVNHDRIKLFYKEIDAIEVENEGKL